ncbi:MAG TPA: SpoIIE family protein phosphatase [Vicinamibacterales bacterium]|nr:SpoIIE family protein phosphatase [Vicinamibacterales bacterium]
MHLEVIDAQGRRHIDLTDGTADIFRIGRREGNDLQLAGTEVSRDHAEIVRRDDDWVLRDKASRYGTYVNGGQVTEHVLKPGDRVRLGRGGGAELVVGDELGTNLGTSGTGGVNDLRQVAALLEGLRALGSGRILDEVLALVLDTAIEIARADRGFIMLGEDSGTLAFKLARGRDRHTLSDASFNTSRKIPEEVFRTGEPRLVADLLDGDLADVHAGTVALGIRHVLCVPLNLVRYVDRSEAGRGPGEAQTRIGVLYLDSREKGDLLSSATRAALETLATEAAVAIENARLYRQTLEKARTDQEIRIAGQIQQALLPQTGNLLPFCETAAAAVPCRSIGGDFFDWMMRPNGSFAFTLGDVAGKGPPAALLSALLQGLFSAQVASADGPAQAVSRMNTALARRCIESRYATLFAGHLEPDGTLMTCNAGHNAPLLVSRSGVARLNEGGMPVGLFESANYGEETVQMSDGDMLVIFSDGVSEALSASEDEFGDERLIEAVKAAGPGSAQHVVDTVLEALRAFTHGAPQSDDVTMVVVRYRTPEKA